MTFEEYVEWLNAQSIVEPDIVTWTENQQPQPEPQPEPPQEDTPMEE
jgi:hypothetical protein